MNKSLTLFLFLCICLVNYGQTTDASGKKQGYWKKKDEKTGKLIYEGLFKDDKPMGQFKYYYPHDTVRAIMNFRDAGKIAYAKLFHINGKRMAYGKYFNREIKDSVWTYYDEAGELLSRETYKMGKKEGPVYIYLPDGGLAEERNYKQDLQNGAFKQYFDGTKIKAQGNYIMGKLEGKVSYYYPNGVEVATGFYKNGEKTGGWIYKNQDGSVKDKELYKNGKLASQKETEAFFSKSKTPGETVKPAQKKPSDPTKKDEYQH